MPERDILSLKCERAFLVGINEQQEDISESNYHLEELHNLVDTMGIAPVDSIMVKLREKNSRYLIGKGKMEEIGELAEDCRADLIIFDCQLSPSQQRNLEHHYNIAVIDRQEVIIDIFADRASTKEAVLQVALARMKYSLPRLTRAWTHLSKQKGGVRGTRGKGETQLESDRRLVLNRINNLKKELEKVKKNRNVQRKKRLERPVPSISIVGYTNAGKSSLLNLLSDADVLTEDKLFATLDPTTRKIKLEGGREIILTDTVGFIRKLPHDLIDAFKSTLEEAVHADVIMHVVDVSNHEYEEHIKVTEDVLKDLGAGEKSQILVFNKTDMIGHDPVLLAGLKNRYPHCITVSVKEQTGIDELLERVTLEIEKEYGAVELLIPSDKWDINAYIHRNGKILEEEYIEDGTRIKAVLTEKDRNILSPYIYKKTDLNR
ncbi:GTPase HflX [Spirochaeta isovalerica]|uniref:GTPase HflX n=1 Tax=Spirochaeta isovalerica TaxID=150 RepID=A0A841R6R1_9SPIO|nr:GTPase HflX [Spirochaeta isovalerica]MBB6478730.1 GTP-binding protein HflX [Spirochaeta isovalerica]